MFFVVVFPIGCFRCPQKLSTGSFANYLQHWQIRSDASWAAVNVEARGQEGLLTASVSYIRVEALMSSLWLGLSSAVLSAYTSVFWHTSYGKVFVDLCIHEKLKLYFSY